MSSQAVCPWLNPDVRATTCDQVVVTGDKADSSERAAWVVAGMTICFAVALLATAHPSQTTLAPLKSALAEVHLGTLCALKALRCIEEAGSENMGQAGRRVRF